MIDLVKVRRVTVYASAALEHSLIPHFISLGATGYTVVPCRGQGEHFVSPDPMTTSTHVRIEMIVQPEAGEKIMLYLQANHLKSQAVAACLEEVWVAPTEHI